MTRLSFLERLIADGQRKRAQAPPPLPATRLESDDWEERDLRMRRCSACEVTWVGEPTCWACGQPVTATRRTDT